MMRVYLWELQDLRIRSFVFASNDSPVLEIYNWMNMCQIKVDKNSNFSIYCASYDKSYTNINYCSTISDDSQEK